MSVALNLSLYLVGEREYVPWATAISWFYTLGNRLSLNELYGQYSVSVWVDGQVCVWVVVSGGRAKYVEVST